MKFQVVKTASCALLLVLANMAHTQAQAQTAPAAAPRFVLPMDVKGQKANELLATLKPPANLQALQIGNNLKLVVPDITASGPVAVEMTSTLPRTDAMWLLTLDPQPDSGSALFAAITLEPAALPQAQLNINLYKTQHLLMVVRAAGKYYGVHKHVKVGEAQSTDHSK
jgi:hypothetical protein